MAELFPYPISLQNNYSSEKKLQSKYAVMTSTRFVTRQTTIESSSESVLTSTARMIIWMGNKKT